MKISSIELKQKLVTAANEIISPEDAAYLADETIEAYIRKSPRTNPLKETINDIEASIKHKSIKIEKTIDLPSYIAYDFHSQGPLVYLKQIHDEVAERASKNGLAAVSFKNSTGLHTLHTWVQGLAKRGLMAIVSCNGGPAAVVPFNGTRGVLGTGPMAYGLPGENGEIYCVDMATSQIPFFEIMQAHKNGKPLRERSAVDQAGEFTTDATKALDFSASETDPVSNIVPMGGDYKGYYIVYLLEVMTSALIGAPSSPEMSDDFIPEEHGAIILAFDPKTLGGSNFNASIQALNKAIKSQKPKAGAKVVVPGEGNNDRFTKMRDQDLEIDNELLKKLDNA